MLRSSWPQVGFLTTFSVSFVTLLQTKNKVTALPIFTLKAFTKYGQVNVLLGNLIPQKRTLEYKKQTFNYEIVSSPFFSP